MPSKGYRKAEPRSFMLRVRLTEDERQRYEQAAKDRGYSSTSAWIRALASAAAGEKPAQDRQ